MADATYVVNRGLEVVTDRLKGVGGAEPNHTGWGTGTTGAAVDDTGLETAAAESRVEGTSTQETTSTTNDTYQVEGTITCTGSGKAITEVCLFDAASDGNCFLRGTFDAINVSVGDGIKFTLKVEFDQA